MNAPEIHTNSVSVVFSLNTGCWDLDESSDESPLRTPELSVYRSAADAAAHNEGLSIVETLNGDGDLWFFSADGSPLEARFSQHPYINFEKNTYFRGVYSLHTGSGTNLFDAIAKIIAENEERSPQARIATWIAGTDKAARGFGWPTTAAMKEGVVCALGILPPDMEARLIFAKIPYKGGFFSSIEDAVRDE